MAQKQNEEASNTKQPALVDMRQAFFSQLRCLCRNIESGIEDLKQVQDPKGTVSYEDSVSAKNFILHTTKGLKELRSQTHEQYKDFVIQSARMSRIQELMKDLIQVYGKRLETVESFIEKYGYVRPEKKDSHKSVDGNPGDREDGESEQDTRSSETDPVDAASSEAVRTPPNTPEGAKARQDNDPLLTPKFEDFFGGMSEAEATLLLDLNKSRVRNPISTYDLDSQAEPTHRSARRSPEPTTFFTMTDTFTANTPGKKICSNTPAKSSWTTPRKAPHLSTPETPEDIRTIIGSMKKSKPDDKPAGSAHFSTPETPEDIRTIIGSMKKSKPDEKPAGSAHLSTPETPEDLRTIIGSMKKSKPDNMTVGPTQASLDASSNQDTGISNPPISASFKPKLSTPETPESVRCIRTTMQRTVPLHERSFPEQPPAYTTKSHLISTPEPPSYVTLNHNSTKEAGQFPRGLSRQHTDCSGSSKLSSFEHTNHHNAKDISRAKSLHLATPETPECFKRYVESTRQIEDLHPNHDPALVPPHSITHMGAGQHNTLSASSQLQERQFECSATSLDILTSEADTKHTKTHQQSKGVSRLKSAKSLFTSPDSGSSHMTQSQTTASLSSDACATANQDSLHKENIHPVQADGRNARRHHNQFSILKTPETPILLKRQVNW